MTHPVIYGEEPETVWHLVPVWLGGPSSAQLPGTREGHLAPSCPWDGAIPWEALPRPAA